MKRFAATAFALTALAACEAPMQSGYYGVSNPIPTAQAAGSFLTVCTNNGANLSAARQTLGGLPVILNPDDDIYYSTEYLISYKITPVSRFESVCSMVWDPIESNATSIATLRSVDPTAVLRDNEDGTITAFHYGAP